MGFVYYECKIAYGAVSARDVSQLTIVDENCMFPIFTGSDLPTTGDYTYSEFAEMMNNIYGTGYYMMDGPGGRVESVTGKLWFPGLTNIFGAVNECIDSRVVGSSQCFWIIVPKLHRVLQGSQASLSEISSVYILNSNGTYAYHPQSGDLSAIFPYILSGQSLFWFQSYGNTVNDFKQSSNWVGRYTISFNVSSPTTTRTLSIRSITISQNSLIALFGDAEEPNVPSTDPYSPDGDSGPGGGDGEFDDPTEPVPIPDPPSISVADTGFVTLFNPSLSQLKDLANYMWSDLFSVESFKKIFADPMQAVLGLSIVPVNVPSAGSREVVVGNMSTGISMTVAAKQFVSVDCGSIIVKPHWGAYLDYDPYTKSFIYLPYIGMHPVSTDDIMGRTIHIKYNVDILSGACTAFIESSGVVLYQFIGQVSSCIPITGDNFSNVINGILGVAGSVGTMVATGGFSAPASIAKKEALSKAYRIGHFIGAGASVGQDIMNMKPSIEKSGSMSGTGGIMGVQKPYLIMLRPNVAIPGGQNQYMGYPSHITARLGDLSGYTEVEMIHLENIPCTENEQDEILDFLAGGVIL